MRVIIVGSGEVGSSIAEALSAEQHDVTVLERDAARSAEVQTELDALVVTGNGASPRVLDEVGAREADLLLAVTDVDEVNMLAAAAAHRLGTARTLARVREEDYVAGQGALLREVLGVDVVIDPERATADDLAEALVVPGAVHVEYFADGRLALAEVALRDDSSLVGDVVAERERVRPHSLVGILRRGRVMIPTAGERLERDAARARFCAERLPGSVVLQEDDLSKDMLLAHGVDASDAFVSCAGDDRTNLLAALHAKELGVRLCLAVVSSEQFVPLVDALGIDGAFSLRLTTTEAILRFVRADVVRALHLTLSGAEALDLHADPGAEIVGAPARGLGRLEGCEVGAILRGDRVVVPDGEERVEAGDRVLLFRLHGAAHGVERAFDA